MKYSKFRIEKFTTKNANNKNNYRLKNQEIKKELYNISDKWFQQKWNNIRYNSFITLFYFTISQTIQKLKDKGLYLLKELNNLILRLAENVNEVNYYDIITFL